MIWLLDTNTIIYALKGVEPVRTRLNTVGADDRVVTSLPVYAKLIYGAEKSERREDNLREVEQRLERIEILPPTRRSAQLFGRIKADLQRRGIARADVDLLIAAQAVDRAAAELEDRAGRLFHGLRACRAGRGRQAEAHAGAKPMRRSQRVPCAEYLEVAEARVLGRRRAGAVEAEELDRQAQANREPLRQTIGRIEVERGHAEGRPIGVSDLARTLDHVAPREVVHIEAHGKDMRLHRVVAQTLESTSAREVRIRSGGSLAVGRARP